MPEVITLVPLDFGAAGRTAFLTLQPAPDLAPGFEPGACMQVTRVWPEQPAPGFLSTAELAYRVSLHYYGLSPGLSIRWCVTPCIGGNFNGLAGGSAGAAFLLALIKLRAEEFDARRLGKRDEIESIEAVRLDWVAASAAIDDSGRFGPVNAAALLLKLKALINERAISGVRLAVISKTQQGIDDHLLPIDESLSLFEFRKRGLDGTLCVLRATDAIDCYQKLFRIQSEQVLL